MATGFCEFGDNTILESSADPTVILQHLQTAYVSANTLCDTDIEFKKRCKLYSELLENGNEEALKFWRKVKEISWTEFQKFYRRLNIRFDCVHGESMYDTRAKQLVREWVARGELFRLFID